MDDLDFVINALASKNCLLFLGPQFAMNEEGQKLHLQLRQVLESQNHELQFDFDNLFILKDSDKAQLSRFSFPLRNEIKNFYLASRPHPIYQKIAALPFRAIISCSPDLFLKDILESKGIQPDFHFYSFDGNTTDTNPGSPILLYNVFGAVSHPQSLIVSFDKFYDFIISMMGSQYKIPKTLQDVLDNPETVMIFIGFDLEKWYIPLLIRRLKYPVTESNQAKKPASAFLTTDNYQEDPEATRRRFFPIELVVSDQDAVSYINQLLHRMSQNHAGSLFFQPDTGVKESLSVISTINRYLRDKDDGQIAALFATLFDGHKWGDLAKASRQLIAHNRIRLLFNLYPPDRLNGLGNTMALLQGNFTGYVEALTEGAISHEEFNRQLVGIRKGLLAVCDHLESINP